MIEAISLDEKGRVCGVSISWAILLDWPMGLVIFLSPFQCALGTEPHVTLLSFNCRAYSVTALTPMAVFTRYSNCAFFIDEIDGCALLDEMTALRLPNRRLPADRRYSMTAPTMQSYPPQLLKGQQQLKSISRAFRNKILSLLNSS